VSNVLQIVVSIGNILFFFLKVSGFRSLFLTVSNVLQIVVYIGNILFLTVSVFKGVCFPPFSPCASLVLLSEGLFFVLFVFCWLMKCADLCTLKRNIFSWRTPKKNVFGLFSVG